MNSYERIRRLVGPNGCGKSTLLKNIYRTLRPKYNTVFIDGNDILKLSSRKMARELAVMAQEIIWNLILRFRIW